MCGIWPKLGLIKTKSSPAKFMVNQELAADFKVEILLNSNILLEGRKGALWPWNVQATALWSSELAQHT